MIKTIKITSIIAAVLLLIGVLFKTMHWPGANVLMSCGALTGILLFITLLAGIPSKVSGWPERLSVVVASLTMIAALAAFTFKAQHWPGANILVRIADAGLFISAIAFLVAGLKEKEARILGLKIIAALFALLLLLVAVLMRASGSNI